MARARLAFWLTLALACGGPDAAPADGEPVGVASGGQAAGVAIERLDASAECDGLLPSDAPAPVVVYRPAAGGERCEAGVSDGTGAVALGARDASGATTWQVYAADGTPRGAFAGDPPLVPAPSGWHVLVRAAAVPPGGDPVVEHVAFGPAGEPGARVRVSPDPALLARFRWQLAPDPAGGSIVVIRSTSVAGNHWSRVDAGRFDAPGARRSLAERITIDDSALEPMFLAGGVSTRGDALVLSQDSAQLDVTWLDASGGLRSSADRAERADTVLGSAAPLELELVPLLDGSLAVRADGAFRRRYEHLATVSGPLPGWLAARPTATLRAARGGRAYAVLPPAGGPSPACTQAVEIVSAGGRACGRITFREEGTGCTARAIDQGWDGTIVQQSGRDPCTYRWWRGLLGGG